ncbi:amino acid adenylation domain-containing protein [Paenibacillus pabuli]|uniref:Amino acid adenylation domain-containing protein n=1 Tax=Paenibacillus pabuli TaxID=1472 RepID=A0ABX9BET1_9BACL|nr:amino acid adenylation domain-containing protein [Paenibacillus pabuli]RAI89565.1 amino acid adenylation domain-containing protein [Paenibacillus pabuli]
MDESSLSIPQMFEEISLRYPDETAVLFDKESMSYKELNAEATRISHMLIDLGVQPSQCIGVFMDRSFDLISCMLGILKSKAIYVPLSVEYPEERIDYIIKDAGINVVITQGNLKPSIKNINELTILDINQIGEAALSSPDRLNLSPYNADDTAYILYTSGTTGYPKGVAIKHSGICNRLKWMNETYKLKPGEVLLHKAPIGFDVSICEIFYPLTNGAVLAVAKPDINKNIRKLIAEMNEFQVNMVHFIPPMLDLFLDCLKPGDCESLRIIVCGGEKWSFSLGEKTLQKLDVDLYNGYGPTEASVGVSYWKFDINYPDRKVPIGKPITNVKFYVLDENLCPVEEGERGELCISGVCLSSGYLNKPEITNNKFVPNPYNHDNIPSYSRLYRSGDLVRQLPDGNIMYIGRTDGQVKIRGMRLELGEVENVLMSNDSISGAIVMHHIVEGNSNLTAYILASPSDKVINESQFKAFLREKLPDYMIPQRIIKLNKFPTTINGKTDKEQLLLAIKNELV